jgi:hypothetical protein
MTARFGERFLCRGCNVLGHHECRILCPTCYEDFLKVVELYQRIVRERPKTRQYTMPQLFAVLYQKVNKK